MKSSASAMRVSCSIASCSSRSLHPIIYGISSMVAVWNVVALVAAEM